MAKLKTVYVCTQCGYEAVRWLGRCPNCESFGTFEEEVVEKKTDGAKRENLSISGGGVSAATRVKDVVPLSEDRKPTNIGELDRVLSGGIVYGSLTLVGGEPGIGKSTLLLQICKTLDKNERPILYVSGEESLSQIKLRAERIGIKNENLFLLSETNLNVIEKTIKDLDLYLVIVDSIQTMFVENVASAPGSVTQVRESTSLLMRIAKGGGVSVIIVGHVTKDGSIAGPRVLEHMVDTVLYFEGEHGASYRIIRAVKNRFGATDEIGVFEMRENGLAEISNPSEYMLSGRPLNTAGSVVTCSIEGTRPILTEVQALVCHTSFGMPRRVASGPDYNRVVMLIAMLEKKAGFQLGSYDAYVNIAGGMKIVEPALDLAVVAAIASSCKNIPVDPYITVFGEAGLAGEARAVAMAERRISEAAKLGFKECIIPQANLKGLKAPNGLRVMGVSNINEMLSILLN